MEQGDDSGYDINDAHNIKYWDNMIEDAKQEIDSQGLNKPDNELTTEEKELKDGLTEGIKEMQETRRSCIADAAVNRRGNITGPTPGSYKRSSGQNDKANKKKK